MATSAASVGTGRSEQVARFTHRLRPGRSLEMDPIIGQALGLHDPRLLRAVTGGGFLSDYVEYATTITDAPTEYHVASALLALATACGNRVYFEQWGQRIHPNLWLVFISPSGWFRKTTAQNIMKRVLVDAGLGEYLLPPQFSRESFLEILADRPAGLLSYGEFGSFLAMLGRDYMSGTKEDLTELFDSPPIYERKLRNATSAKICYPAINLQAGTVINWLTGRVREGDVRGGFLARFLFVVATQKHGWMGLTRPQEPAKKNVLVKHLAAVAKLAGVVDLEPIRAPYETWLRAHESEEPDPDLTGFFARLGTYALKFAVLFELARPTPALTITPDSWERAEAMIDYLRTHIVSVVSEQVTANPWQAKRVNVLAVIRKKSGILYSDLLRAVKLPQRELGDILATLQAEESIQEQTTPPGPKGGRPGRRFYPRFPRS